MKGQRFRRIIFCLGSALFLLACALPFAPKFSTTGTPQSLVPNLIGTPIAQTAAAAQTQTVAFLPPSLTPTLTPFPTGTQIEVTSAPTFFFALPTFTPLPTWTPLPGIIIQVPGGSVNPAGTDSNSPFTGEEWTCGIRTKNPPMGTVIERGASFYVTITLFNSGTKTWTNNGIDFVYTGGYRIEGTRIQDLPITVASGKEVTVKSLVIAPKNPDTYNIYWTLKVGNHKFCGMKYTFVVK
jgi:hypothetical protein